MIDKLIQAIRAEFPDAYIQKTKIESASNRGDFKSHYQGVEVFLPENACSQEKALEFFTQTLKTFPNINMGRFTTEQEFEPERKLEFNFMN